MVSEREAIAKMQVAKAAAAKELQEKRAVAIRAAAKQLSERMSSDQELQRLSAMILAGHQMIRWASSKMSELDDITSPMIQLIYNAEEARASSPFNFVDTIDGIKKFGSWFDDIRREAQARIKTNEKRVSAIIERAQHVDEVPLPFSQFAAKFKDNKMSHDDALVVFGPTAGLMPMLRMCAKSYAKNGGIAAVLAATDKIDKFGNLQVHTLGSAAWHNIGDTYGSFMHVMKDVPGNVNAPVGLMIVENLDNLLIDTLLVEPRQVRLVRALALLRQFQGQYPMGLIVGISTDNDQPAGVTPEEVYPPFITDHPHISIALEQSKLAKGFMNILIDKDVIPMTTVWNQLSEE